MDANESVLKALENSGKPLKTSEIAELAGIDQKEVSKAIKVLKEEGQVISPKVCYYSINK